MKTKDELVSSIMLLVMILRNTVNGGGKFLPNERVGMFWDSIRDECGLRMVSPSSFDTYAVFGILSAYTKAKKRKGYDCACQIAETMFKACDSSVVAVLFKIPFEANFKPTQHVNTFVYGHGYSIRNAHVSDFARASADIIISLGTRTGVASDLEIQIFNLFAKHSNKVSDQELAEALVNDLEKFLQAEP